MSSRCKACGIGLGLGIVVLLSGCGSATNATLSDPAATSAQVAALDSAFDAPALGSFQAMGSSITPAPPIAQMAARAIRVVRVQSGGNYANLAAMSKTIRQFVPAFAAISQSAIFGSLDGSVYTWNTSSNAYQQTATTGGPSNGVRFILYAIDPLTGVPSSPLTQVGYVDLMDESTGSAAILHVKVNNTGGTVTYLDYTFTGSGSSTNFSASVSGTVSNGLSGGSNKTLSFNVSISGGSSSVTLSSTYTLNNPAVTVSESMTIADNGTTTTLTVNFTFSRTGEAVNAQGTIALNDADGSGTVNVTFKVNGGTYATLTGDVNAPSLARSGGGQLSGAEQDALGHLFIAAADISEKTGEIFNPAESVLGF